MSELDSSFIERSMTIDRFNMQQQHYPPRTRSEVYGKGLYKSTRGQAIAITPDPKCQICKNVYDDTQPNLNCFCQQCGESICERCLTINTPRQKVCDVCNEKKMNVEAEKIRKSLFESRQKQLRDYIYQLNEAQAEIVRLDEVMAAFTQKIQVQQDDQERSTYCFEKDLAKAQANRENALKQRDGLSGLIFQEESKLSDKIKTLEELRESIRKKTDTASILTHTEKGNIPSPLGQSILSNDTGSYVAVQSCNFEENHIASDFKTSIYSFQREYGSTIETQTGATLLAHTRPNKAHGLKEYGLYQSRKNTITQTKEREISYSASVVEDNEVKYVNRKQIQSSMNQNTDACKMCAIF